MTRTSPNAWQGPESAETAEFVFVRFSHHLGDSRDDSDPAADADTFQFRDAAPVDAGIAEAGDALAAETFPHTEGRIPTHSPDWTNHNDSDPGTAVSQLFHYPLDLVVEHDPDL